MFSLYYTFNFITGYRHDNPPVRAIEWRLIVLESIAGVPGFVAAGNLYISIIIFISLIYNLLNSYTSFQIITYFEKGSWMDCNIIRRSRE
jgi:hypothetical protein